MNTLKVYSMLSGMVIMGCWVAGLFFHRAWKKTSDRLFILFAVAFWILGLERVLPTLMDMSGSAEGSVYYIRLVGFVLILFAVIDKNRTQKKRQG